VNRKKQKRRQKQAARLAAEHPDAYAPGDADSRVTDEQRSYKFTEGADVAADPVDVAP
jgi:hypothetical protein